MGRQLKPASRRILGSGSDDTLQNAQAERAGAYVSVDGASLWWRLAGIAMLAMIVSDADITALDRRLLAQSSTAPISPFRTSLTSFGVSDEAAMRRRTAKTGALRSGILLLLQQLYRISYCAIVPTRFVGESSDTWSLVP